jgi:hypothetical protein
MSHPALAALGWENTGEMGTARNSHTATPLENGKALIVGGYSPSGWTSSAEVYDPEAGTFTSTGSMGTARYDFTATLLGNGKVLIAGGFGASGGVTGGEVYDPGTGMFTTTGSMGTECGGHTATLLRNGKVLIAGGWGLGDPGTYPNFAEGRLFDPGTRTFTPTGVMGTVRWLPTATLLDNGNVLIAGGYGGGGFGTRSDLSSAEVYDPVTGTFTPTGSMTTGRVWHTATLLDNGSVLIAGGTNRQTTGYLSSAEVYNPMTGTFTSTGSMGTVRSGHTAMLLRNGLVLIAGGGDTSGALSSAEIYTPMTGTFTPTGRMATDRRLHTGMLLGNGKVLVTGGQSTTTGSLFSAEIYRTVEAAAPTFSQAPGTYPTGQSVTISTTTPGATIRFTTDGSTPSGTVGTVYSAPISVPATMTIKAVAYLAGFADSAVLTGVYTITPGVAAAPTFSPTPGTYTSGQSVTISTTTPGATIRFTTDGSTPNGTVGTVYSTPISVPATMTIKSVAYLAGLTDSPVSTGTYTITPPSVSSGGGGGGGCSISPDGKSKGESPLGTILALLSPGIILVVRKTFRRKKILQ